MAGLGRKVWAADEVLSAEDLQDYIQDQVVFVYDNSSARASGILAPTEGMVSYLKDTNLLYVHDGTGWVEVAPDVGTPGTYTKVTTDAKGRVASGTTLSASDIPNLNADKITAGTFNVLRIPDLAASKITSGEFATARIPDLDASKITSGTISRPVNTTGNITGANVVANGAFTGFTTGNIVGAFYNGNAYNQTNSGRALFVASDGLFGIGSSSIRFKENVVDAEIDVDAVLDIAVRNFTYKSEFDSNNSVQIGVIAEELVELGLDEFVFFNDDGEPDGVAYEKLALALIPVIQSQQSRLDLFEARLKKLEK